MTGTFSGGSRTTEALRESENVPRRGMDRPPFFHQPRLWDTAGKLAARKAPERGLQDFSITDLHLAFKGQLGGVFNLGDRHV